MDIVVCIKQVPDPEIPTSQFKVDEVAKRVVPPEGVAPVISTFDLHAIEAAIQLKEQHGGKVTVISLGPPSVRDALKRAIAMGCDAAVQLEDPAFEGGDSYATAVALAAAIKKLGTFDLVLTGRQAADWDSGQAPAALAELLDVAAPCRCRRSRCATAGCTSSASPRTGTSQLTCRSPRCSASATRSTSRATPR